MKIAILTSNHQEVARIPMESLDWIFNQAGNPCAEDFLKVLAQSKTYWCDEIEFVEDNSRPNETG